VAQTLDGSTGQAISTITVTPWIASPRRRGTETKGGVTVGAGVPRVNIHGRDM